MLRFSGADRGALGEVCRSAAAVLPESSGAVFVEFVDESKQFCRSAVTLLFSDSGKKMSFARWSSDKQRC